MPRRRKKSSRSSRKPPLVFSESPLNLSVCFASPVSGAVNPVTAEVISLQEQCYTTWVSPQFDPTAPPSARRRRGRRRGTENARGACSQNPQGRKDVLADIDIISEENWVCDRRKLDYVSGEESLTDMDCTNIEGNNKENCNRVYIGNQGDKNDWEAFPMSDKSNIDSDMSLCSLVAQCTLISDSRTGSRATPRERCIGEQNQSNKEDKRGGCPTCTGSCVSLANDTPVEEYSLRVSRRKRRGRLPKAAWEKLVAGV